MVTIKIDECDLVKMLVDRVRFWTADEDVVELFDMYYQDMADSGCFNGCDLDVMNVVDNDYINWTTVYTAEELKDEEWVTDDRILAHNGDLYLVYAA